jgi:hypothetical protein
VRAARPSHALGRRIAGELEARKPAVQGTPHEAFPREPGSSSNHECGTGLARRAALS